MSRSLFELRYRVLGIICVVVLVAVTIFNTVLEKRMLNRALVKSNYDGKFPLQSNQSGSALKVPIAKAQSSIPGAAFVFLGLGAQAYQMNCPAAIESLVRHGGWGGDVFLITDRASCFDEVSIIRNAGMQKDNFHLVELDEDFGGGGVDVKHLNLGAVSNRIRSKVMKAKLFDLIGDPSIDVIGYVDCDVLFAIEGCPRDFLQGGEPWEDRKVQFSRLKINSAGYLYGLHTGSIVMHREYSKEALDIWAEELGNMDYILDRMSYLTAFSNIQEQIDRRHNSSSSSSSKSRSLQQDYNHLRSTVHESKESSSSAIAERDVGVSSRQLSASYMHKQYKINPMLPGLTRFPPDADGNRKSFESFFKPYDSLVPHCINHISKARCDRFGRETVQSFVDRFQLRSYQQSSSVFAHPADRNSDAEDTDSDHNLSRGGDGVGVGRSYPYCPSKLLSPMLYGWFPFSYLPFCPKIEQYL